MALTQQQMLALLALGGGAYLLNQEKHSGPPPSSAGAVPGHPRMTPQVASRTLRAADSLRGPLRVAVQHLVEKTGKGAERGSIDQKILENLKLSWEAADAAGRTAICARLKEQFPTNPQVVAMDCAKAPGMSFGALTNIAAAAAGTAACGPGCGAVAALVAAWAGPTMKEWGERAWQDIKDAGDWIGGAAKSVWGWIH